jgi:hypothetical protein
MNPSSRIVVRMPMDALWSALGPVAATRVRYLRFEELRSALAAGPVRFVVANIGAPLRWIPEDLRFEFWKTEIKDRIADPDGPIFLEDFPDGLAMVASEWLEDGCPPIVLLECHH